MKKTLLALLTIFSATIAFAQENETDPVRDYVDSVRFTRQQVELIQNLKFSGYYQFQYQLSDTAGVGSYEGGNFSTDVNNRFTIRRGRLKMTYSDKISTYVLQFDATERGVAIRDAYIKMMEQKFKKVELTAGVFDRPFGYEISYSSRLRESPERGRMSQILFPNERDLGAMLSYTKNWKAKKQVLRVDAGLFNGTGFLTTEFDSKKDIISRITYENNKGKFVKYGFGASMYQGKLINQTKYVYSMNDTKFQVDSTADNLKNYARRQYYGVNAQLNFFSRIGFTIIRAEYITGTQPGTHSSSSSPTAVPTTTNTYIRNFNGAYVYFIQNILKSRHQVLVKYDWYDPNTDVAGTEIGAAGSATNATDIKYSTLGFGYIYRATDHIRWMTYYDIVKNENTSLTGANSTNNYSKDLKDNVFTVRMQYRF